jgi:hypothetical protein
MTEHAEEIIVGVAQAAGVELGQVAVPQAKWIYCVNAWWPSQRCGLRLARRHTIQS